MTATGNEVARLKQLRDIYPKVVSLTSGGIANITLGNGKVVTFSGKSGGTRKVRLLVRAMYNSFELLQGVSDGAAVDIRVRTTGSMKTFGMRMLGEKTGNFYTISDKALNELFISTGGNLDFKITNKFVAFIGATIYVE